jgi:hypothetical protein
MALRVFTSNGTILANDAASAWTGTSKICS